MDWDYQMARALKKLLKGGAPQPYYEAVVVKTAPLTFSLLEGELMAPPAPLMLTQAAAEHTGEDCWRVGDKAAALVSGTVLIIDRIGG